MEHFDSEAAKDVLSFFRLGVLGKISKIPTGKQNSSYFVEASNSTYVVRVYRRFNNDILQNELAIQEQLASHGILTNFLLTGGMGSYVYTGNNIVAVVSKKIEGAHPKECSLKECELIGSTLASFHQYVSMIPFNYGESLLNYDKVTSEVSSMKAIGYKYQLEKLLASSSVLHSNLELPIGIRHCDFHRNNILIHKNSIAVLDVEGADHGILLCDVARSIADICRVGDYLKKDKVSSFLQGYNQKRKLSPIEIELLPEAIQFGCASISLWLFTHNYFDLAEVFLNIGLNQESN